MRVSALGPLGSDPRWPLSGPFMHSPHNAGPLEGPAWLGVVFVCTLLRRAALAIAAAADAATTGGGGLTGALATSLILQSKRESKAERVAAIIISPSLFGRRGVRAGKSAWPAV